MATGTVNYLYYIRQEVYYLYYIRQVDNVKMDTEIKVKEPGSPPSKNG